MPVTESELALANFTFELDQLKPAGRSANDSYLITLKPWPRDSLGRGDLLNCWIMLVLKTV